MLLGRVLFCLALNENIYFTRKGWNHLVNKRGRMRAFGDIARRSLLFPLVEDLVNSEHATITFRNSFVSIEGITRGVLIRIVTIRDRGGKLIFLSVMDKKIGKVSRAEAFRRGRHQW